MASVVQAPGPRRPLPAHVRSMAGPASLRLRRSSLRFPHKDGAGLKTLRPLTAVTASVALVFGLLPVQAVAGYGDNTPRAVLKNNLGRQVGPSPTSGGGRKEGGGFCGAWVSDGWADWPKAL